jgi:hypothetical protein
MSNYHVKPIVVSMRRPSTLYYGVGTPVTAAVAHGGSSQPAEEALENLSSKSMVNNNQLSRYQMISKQISCGMRMAQMASLNPKHLCRALPVHCTVTF